MGESSTNLSHRDAHRHAHRDRRTPPAVGEGADDEIAAESAQRMDVVKIGGTHLEDAVPLSVGQEWSRWAAQLQACLDELHHFCNGLLELAVCGTAVDTGLNAPKGFSRDVADALAELTLKLHVPRQTSSPRRGRWTRWCARTPGCAVGGRADENRQRHAAAGLRAALWVAEPAPPANEPGPSIMPGKVNPNQCEAW